MPVPEEWRKYAPTPRPLEGKDKWNVFLSYRSVNRAWVLNLYDVLREQGHNVFLDQVVLKAGDQLIRALEDGLATSQAGVLVYSSASRDSDWVLREYQVMEAMDGRRPDFRFVPIQLDETELPLFAQTRVFLDFAAYPDGPNGGELLRLLHAVVGVPLSEEAARFAAGQDEKARAATTSIRAAIKNGNPARLVDLYEKGGVPWETSAMLGSRVGEGLTKLDCPDDAIRILVDVEAKFPKAIRPKQLHALALARRGRTGDLDKAQEFLGELYESGHRDPETLGIYGRTWMDRYVQSGDAKHLAQSRDLYVEAFEGARDDYYTGINAAAKSVLLGTPEDLEAAKGYATQVQEIVGAAPVHGDYWMTATVAEVLLIRGEFARAGEMYKAAVQTAGSEKGSHRTTFTQAQRLMDAMKATPDQRAPIERHFADLTDS